VQPQPFNPPKPPVKNITAPSDTSSDLSSLHNATSMDDPAMHGRSPTDEEFENLYSTLDTGRLFLTDNFSKTPTDLISIATHADLKVKLQLFKVRLLLLTRNLKVAKRELKLAMNMARGRDSSTELLLKSQLEYVRGNHRKAVKLLSLPPGNRTEPATAAMFYNNLGCILHQQGSHHAANMLFCKALKESSALHSKPLKLNLFSQDKSCLVSYNLGLQHLISGKPLSAARCFREAVSFFGNRPLFWLRFAECSLLALEMGLLTEPSCGKEGITVNIVGSGQWRQLIVNGCEGKKKEKIDGLELISLPSAREYLVNAMLLMQVAESEQTLAALPDDVVSDQSQARATGQKNSSGGTDSKVPTITSGSVQVSSVNGVASGGSNLNATLVSSVASYAKICEKENLMIKQALFADLAYVDLCLKNPLRAWKFAKSLIQLPDCSRKYLFLGHVYAAEALCLLNMLKEATELLSIYIEGENSVVLPFTDEDESESWVLEREKERDGDGDESAVDVVVTKQMSDSKHLSGSVLKPEEARAMLYVNLSVVAAIQGNVEQAAAFVKQAFSSLPENPRVVLASVYIDLLKGNSVDALTKLRQCRNVRFQSSGSATV
jgi:CCR4-NOT transcription complex subunit 10